MQTSVKQYQLLSELSCYASGYYQRHQQSTKQNCTYTLHHCHCCYYKKTEEHWKCALQAKTCCSVSESMLCQFFWPTKNYKIWSL